MESSYFYCPGCGRDVKAPHFCESKDVDTGAGFQIDLTKYVFGQKPADPFPDVPAEYTEALAENDAKLEGGQITEHEHEETRHYVENLISNWRRLNGKEVKDGMDIS